MILRLSIAFLLSQSLCTYGQQTETRPVDQLRQAAENYVIAFNEGDAKALTELFTKDGEITDLNGEKIVAGHNDLLARFEGLFAGDEKPQMAIEVKSVRIVSPGLAIEDGTAHIRPGGSDAPPRSVGYCAVLKEDEKGNWKIASSRTLLDKSPAATFLEPLAKVLVGDWTLAENEGVQLDLAIGWHQGGQTLVGDILTTPSDSPPREGGIRFSWDPKREAVVSTIFDEAGGVVEGLWFETESGWLVRSRGRTADGTMTSSTQKITPEENGALLWSITNQVIGNEVQPDRAFRLTPRPPAPSSK